MTHWWQKIGIAAGTIASIAGALKDVPIVPEQYQPVVVAVGTIAAAISGLYHPKPQPQPLP
jgi:hypothetical protein